MVAHFRLFALCSAGRAEGSLQFEFACLVEHLGFYIRFLSSLAETGYALQDVRVILTDLDHGMQHEKLRSTVIEPLAARFPGVGFELDPDRQAGRGYYEKFCFGMYAKDIQGVDHNLVDGGFTNWTQQLLSNKKERLLISGIGIERLASLYSKKLILKSGCTFGVATASGCHIARRATMTCQPGKEHSRSHGQERPHRHYAKCCPDGEVRATDEMPLQAISNQQVKDNDVEQAREQARRVGVAPNRPIYVNRQQRE